MQSNYFQQLTQELKQQGTGTPQLILDLAQPINVIWSMYSQNCLRS